MNLIKSIIDDFKKVPAMFLKYDAAAKSKWEVIFLYPGFKAIILHRVAFSLWNNKMYFFARFISELSRFLTQVEIHPGAKIGSGLMIDHGGGTVIGETAIVGDNVIIFHNVTLGSIKIGVNGKRHPTVGDGVVLGENCSVLGDVKIQNKVKISSKSMVTEDVQLEIEEFYYETRWTN